MPAPPYPASSRSPKVNLRSPRALAAWRLAQIRRFALTTPVDNLAATPVGVGLATGDLSDQENLATGAVGVGAAVGALSVIHLLASAPIGVGKAAGTLGDKHLVVVAAIGVALLGGTLSSASTTVAPVALASKPITAGGGGAQRRSAYNVGVPQPPRVIKVPDWLIDSYLRGEIDEEEFAVLVALQ